MGALRALDGGASATDADRLKHDGILVEDVLLTLGDIELLVAANLSDGIESFPLGDEWDPAGSLISNYDGDATDRLRPWDAFVLKRQRRVASD